MTSPNKVDAYFSPIDVRVDDFDNAAWRKATPIVISHYWSGEIAPPSRHAEAWIIWTPQALLARFVCRQSEPMIVNPNPQTATKTRGLWDRDVCELFLNPNVARRNHYFEFEAAPTGEWIDLELEIKPTGRETNWDFTSGMTTAHRIGAEQLTITIRVPWSTAIPAPARGDEWAANFFRCIGDENTRGYLAWQPTKTPKPNFHVPEAFGRLRFVA